MHQQTATPVAYSSSSKNLSLSQWETVTRQGLAATHEGGATPALPGYEQALSLAR